ncbi:hypothetical protein [Klebsiella quasipneumoniae]|uniref:hypothetical protein n=1 Tax=Klebsiella quasipneumoniae TaxID=1463165 RepID=UPI0021DAC658|nr:hypothetical protein [Klebsiella quasipneumoniae]MCU8824337.1 hypothetical protein [Klebsiella quasipneumoniae]
MTNNQLTKEWLQQTIAELESVRDEIPFGIDTNSELELAAFKLALAAMDSEPVAYTDEAELNFVNDMACMWTKGMGINEVPLYRHAQPAPVVPTFDEWLELRGNKPLGWVKDAMRESYDACRAAMLQTEPAMTANKLPETQFKQVADLYEMQFDDGRTCAFHTDAEKAVQWLNTCDGNKVQEYVKLERLHDAVSGNSPVIPDGWKLVPVEPNGDMLAAAQDAYGETDGDIASTLRAAIAAAQPAPTIQVTDAMAYAFHHALTDGPLGDEDVEDIKAGLRSAFANATANQPTLVLPDDYQNLSELYHALEKRLFKIVQRIKGTSFDKYAHTPSQAIDVLEESLFGEDDITRRATMLAVAPPAPKSTAK